MHLKCTLLILLLLTSRHCAAQEVEICASTISELRVMLTDQRFPLLWEEISMNDEKPMMVSILEVNGNLVLEFTKTREGLWAKSAAVICKAGANIEAHFTKEQIQTGPAANWVSRYSLKRGGKFTLTKLRGEQLRIATNGWSGTFSASLK